MTDIEATELIRYMEHWGYDLSELAHARSPGYNRLVVAMRERPTEEHYDPEAIHVQLFTPQGHPLRTTIQMETTVPSDATVCPGYIELTDRFGARVAFFTYGASIDRGSNQGETVIDIRSPVPILELSGSLDESIGEQLVSETEAMWAKARAHWGTDDSGFTDSLASVPPAALYASTVASLWNTYQDSRILRQTFPQFYGMLRREIEWIGRLDIAPATVQTLDEMLSPSDAGN